MSEQPAQPQSERPTPEPAAEQQIPDIEALMAAVERLLVRDLTIARERLGVRRPQLPRHER